MKKVIYSMILGAAMSQFAHAAVTVEESEKAGNVTALDEKNELMYDHEGPITWKEEVQHLRKAVDEATKKCPPQSSKGKR